MASSKAVIVSSLLLLSFSLFLFLLHAEQSSTMGDGDNKFDISLSEETGDDDIDCDSKCDYRCSKASRHKMCIRACRTCCNRCHCVPPGTSGNEDVCPCYANMTTHGGRHKCP